MYFYIYGYETCIYKYHYDYSCICLWYGCSCMTVYVVFKVPVSLYISAYTHHTPKVFICDIYMWFDLWWQIHSNGRSLLYSHRIYPATTLLTIVPALSQKSLSLAWEGNSFHINNVCKTNKFLRRTSFWVLVHSKRFENVVFAENALVKDGGSNLSVISADTCYFSGPVFEEVP